MECYNPDLHHRHSIRLKGYDYSKAGAYFVTICTKNRECLFGEIVKEGMVLNDAGRMVEKWWLEVPKKFSLVETDEHVIMPNHFHGIIIISVGATLRGRPDEWGGLHTKKGAHIGEGNHIGLPLRVTKKTGRRKDKPTLGEIMDWFKTMTTNEYIRGVKESHWSPFNGTLWQRNYYERIVRSEEELNRFREYIQNNPMQWEMDEENPERNSVKNARGLLPSQPSLAKQLLKERKSEFT
jgi:REP element-mobilizing transposase RayT